MSEIREFIVVEPPTSAEVERRAVDALSRGIMQLVVKGDYEVPTPTDQDVEFRIRQTVHPEDGGMIISGQTDDDHSVTVRTHQDDATAPARVTIIG